MRLFHSIKIQLQWITYTLSKVPIINVSSLFFFHKNLSLTQVVQKPADTAFNYVQIFHFIVKCFWKIWHTLYSLLSEDVMQRKWLSSITTTRKKAFPSISYESLDHNHLRMMSENGLLHLGTKVLLYLCLSPHSWVGIHFIHFYATYLVI